MNLNRLATALTIAAAASLVSFRTVYEPDLGYHLAHGREDVAGRLVRANVFSFTYPEYRQHYTSWLFDTGAYAAWIVGGGAGIQALQALLLAAALGIVYAACRVRAPVLPSVAVLVLGFFVIETRAIPRPHLASFAGLAACAWMIERAVARRSAAPLLWAVPLVAVWSNVHVECVFGVLLVAVFAIAEAVRPSSLSRRDARRAVAIAAACAIATMANPYGWGLLLYLYENASVPQILSIAELQPAYLPTYRAFFVYVVALGALLLLLPRRLTLREGAAALMFAALGFRYARLTPLVVLATAPALAGRIAALIARGIDGRAVLVTALAAAAVISRVPLATLVTGVHAGSSAVYPASMFSPGAVEFARKEQLSGPLFNSLNLGGWLAWTLYPQARIFQDTRLQAYPPEHLLATLDASQSQREWDDLTRGVDWAVLSRPRTNQLSGAGRFPRTEWATVFWDEAVELLVRREGRFRSIAESREYRFLTPDAEVFVLAARLAAVDGVSIRAEAERNRSENPEGFAAAAILCIGGDAAGCAAVERIGARRPEFQNAVALVRLLRPK